MKECQRTFRRKRNLLAKKFIKKITYFKKNIKAALYYPQYLKVLKMKKLPICFHEAKRKNQKMKKYVLDSESRFVSKMIALLGTRRSYLFEV